ncbi:MAG: Asp-tRNA(Asn)/Glu-tRNA(Gln) amidotransferase GatCAB subunit A [Verrucomicrobia bacterium]|nr:MAG: Asp-tRNA(Asn)/Glu-tRNA(Gln) amidotransferase GatCAB subunit A [Verrucomicrobiota bacterium]
MALPEIPASLRDLRNLLLRGEIACRDVAAAFLQRIEKHNACLNAFVHLDAEKVMAQAERADERLASGGREPLLGIPLAIKDNLNVRGDPCTCASRILTGYVAPYDATAVARLRKAGAVFLGRTNMDEFAMGSSNENSAFGPVRNPWNTDYVPGGSSGGAAAAVAAGLAPAALASDTGGSIRQPAAFCGCVGLKPTYGRVSRYGLTAYASSMDQVGVLAQSVADAALLLEVIAGHDVMDGTSLREEVPPYSERLEGDLNGVRIGLPREYYGEGLDKEVRESVQGVAGLLAREGAEVVEVDLPSTRYAVAAYYIIATAEASANLARYDGVRYGMRVEGADPIEMYGRTRAKGFGPEVKRRIILGTYALSSGYYDAYYLRATKVRTLIRKDFEEAFQRCEVLLTPVSPVKPFRLGEKIEDPLQLYLCDIYSVTANLAGICGIAVPCGLSREGLPLGAQFLGPALGEERILQIAHIYEALRGPFGSPPGF